MTAGDGASTPRQIESTRELLDCVDLTGVHYRAVSGLLLDEPRDQDETDTSIGVSQLRQASYCAQRFELLAKAETADYRIVVETHYRYTEPLSYTPEIAQDFVERVAVMAAFPFLREALAATARRLEQDVPILGLLKAGQFRMTPQEPSDHAEASRG